jgi:hypothetical protein
MMLLIRNTQKLIQYNFTDFREIVKKYIYKANSKKFSKHTTKKILYVNEGDKK